MIKSILVPIAGGEHDRAYLRNALAAAQPFAAHLDVLHVRPDPAQLIAAAASAAYGDANLVAAFVDQFEKDAKERLATARTSFLDFVKEERLELRDKADGAKAVSAAWLEPMGHEGERVAQLGRCRDLFVVGRSREAGGLAPGTLESALMEGGRPILVVSPRLSRTIGRTVVVAWKDTAEAARAVTAAMPILKMAAIVLVIEVRESEGSATAPPGASGERLVAALAWHDIKADARTVLAGNRSGPEALLATAQDAGADLVVMGAYGHSRMRELIFGGFTRHILHNAELPVLMFH